MATIPVKKFPKGGQMKLGATDVAPSPPPAKSLSISVFGQKLSVAGIYSVTATLGMPIFVFAHVHHKSGDRSDGRVGSCTRPRPILPLLVVSFPLQAEFEARLPALLSIAGQPFHLVFVHLAVKGELAADR